MNRKIGLLILVALSILLPAAAQEDSYTWDTYDFNISLPPGWTALPDSDREILKS